MPASGLPPACLHPFLPMATQSLMGDEHRALLKNIRLSIPILAKFLLLFKDKFKTLYQFNL
jgi:hypothetical protein